MGGCALYANKNKIDKNIPIELIRIELKDSRIDSLINTILKQNKAYMKKGCYVLIGINKGSEDNSTEIVITLYEKEKFKLSCPENDYPIIGYAEISKQTVLFIGKVYSEKMKITEDKKEFTFNCRNEGKNYPPSLYNPAIHKFLLKNTGEPV
jgi:hypothetical protein